MPLVKTRKKATKPVNIAETDPAANEETGEALRFNQEGLPVQELRHLMSNLIRTQELDDNEYLVCPTVLICEGVHNGVYYPPEELSKFPDSWNGRPVVINHPDLMGKSITDNSPARGITVTGVGLPFNTF
jgi:hypothetical protein